MSASPAAELNDLQKQIFEKITNKDVGGLKQLLAQLQTPIDFIDDNGMTPLQHACYKQCKEAVQCILDQGADVNLNRHATKYSALHFAALSGSTDICCQLLAAGADPQATNSVSRTPAQMAAFVGNHAAVATINNYVPKADVAHYTTEGCGTTPLPVYLLDALHAFVIQTNMHPVRIALNLQKCAAFGQHLADLRAVLVLMAEREMERRCSGEVNEIAAFKYHYLGWVVGEIVKCREHATARRGDAGGSAAVASAVVDGSKPTADYVELFAKRVLKENRAGQLDYVESTVRECVREFPHRECTIFRQIVTQLAAKDASPALDVVRGSVNGHRGFVDDITYCSTCGDVKPDKKCSKCKKVQYCDRECQRLHWFMHKKTCARPISSTTTGSAKKDIDMAEISEQLQNMVAG